MLLRFEGGPCDGLEEESDTAPYTLVRALRAPGRHTPLALDRSSPMATYELAELDVGRDIATYRAI
ncbi:MAG: hypothetical protein ABI317_14420 [Gaiellales bacterium]